MPYPKPLMEKTLNRQYAASGLSGEQIEFLKKFFLACANLYGALMASDAWWVYTELSEETETVRLRRKDMYAALGILRREEVPYYVFEANEVYADESRDESRRIIVRRDLVIRGYGRFRDLRTLMEESSDKPFYVPKDFLEYATMPESPEEAEFLKFLGGMRSTRPEFKTEWAIMRFCPYRGKLLSEFSYISSNDQFELSRLKGEFPEWRGNPKRAAEFEAKLNSITADRYLVDRFKRRINIGNLSYGNVVGSFFYDLNSMGVAMTEEVVGGAMHGMEELNDSLHLWCNRGWTPKELNCHTAVRVTAIPELTAQLVSLFDHSFADLEELLYDLDSPDDDEDLDFDFDDDDSDE